jgi:hypothetical protein
VKPTLPSKLPHPTTSPREEIKVAKESGSEVREVALCIARPVEELVDFENLDQIGKIVERILFGVIEEKFDALVLFNETLTTKLAMMKESLVKNALFITRTFSDVLDGVLDPRREDVLPKFVKYFIQVFKK